MIKSTGDKIWAKILGKLSAWASVIIILGAVMIYFFFPALVEDLRTTIVFWGPVVILALGFIIILTHNKIRGSRDLTRGIYEYNITITRVHFYLIDTIIFIGTFLILAGAVFFDGLEEIRFSDLIQAALFYFLAVQIKGIFYRKISSD